MKIEGKIAVVFGGALGMGRSFSEVLLKQGAKVKKEYSKKLNTPPPGCCCFIDSLSN